MSGNYGIAQVWTRYRRYLILSLLLTFILVPVVDSFVIQRDRNRNMVFGELFWSEGLDVYDMNDQYLNETFDVPEDHLLTDVLNVTYEYPLITLLFYALIAGIEPGIYGPHYLVNWITLLIAHLNLILFLYLGQGQWDKKWFWQFFGTYYIFTVGLSLFFAKTEPLADLFWLIAIVFYKGRRYWFSQGMLAIATQTKLYPAMIEPVLLIANPLSSISFIIVNALLLLPFILNGKGYDTLFNHVFNREGYASMITNPFYIGWIGSNILAIIPIIVLLIAFAYAIFAGKRTNGILLPLGNLEVRSARTILIFILPFILVLFSWVLMWYYAWFIIPVLLIEESKEASRYRYILLGIGFAHVFGILINLDYFILGPIAEFLGHLK